MSESFPFHPIAEEYEMLSGPDFDNLVESIRANGLRVPITRLAGQILDGRNRYLACQKADVQPRYTEYNGDTAEESLREYVKNLNEDRRHLTPEALQKKRQQRVARITQLRGEGKSTRAISEIVGVSQSQVLRDIGVRTEPGGSVEPETVVGKDGKRRAAKITRTREPGADAPAPEDVPIREREPGEEEEEAVAPDAVVQGADATQEPKQHVPVDKLGQPLSEAMQEVFTAAQEFGRLEYVLDDVARRLDALARTAAGWTVARQLQLKGYEDRKYTCSHLHNVKRLLMDSRPYCGQCPECLMDQKATPDEKCSFCYGTGWLTERLWKAWVSRACCKSALTDAVLKCKGPDQWEKALEAARINWPHLKECQKIGEQLGKKSEQREAPVGTAQHADDFGPFEEVA